ncbi:MAG TPA: polysaccharide deacetylase family protein, partial [Thermoleophilia bacterium]|nr:polysaccharide deacetylase family protein [Thermoleophilia bacterium]
EWPEDTTQPAIAASDSPWPDDTTPPVTRTSGTNKRWHAKAVTVRLTATDDISGVAATAYSLDGGTWVEGAEIVIGAPRNHSNDGEHTLTYASVDNAGNRELDQQVTVKIDTTPPGFSWVSVSPSVIHRVSSVSFRFVIRETSGPVNIRWRATDQYGELAVARSDIERRPGARVVSVSPRYKNGKAFLPGLYNVRFTLTDEAGNVTITKPRPFRNYAPAKAKVWRRVSGAGKRVALTFDDGGASAWRSMLNTLKRYKAHATFFPLGPFAAASPDLMRRTLAEGHGIGSHGWTHTSMTSQSSGAVRSELLRSAAPWWSGAKATPVPYVRPPYGAYNSNTVAACGSIGFSRVIMWDVDPQDWRQPGASVIAARVLSRVRSGSIVVMHLRSQTAAALPAILRGLRARGYKAVSLPELFRAAGYR